MKKFLLTILTVAMLTGSVFAAGSWSTNQFSYKPQLTTQGTTDYTNFNTSQDRIDTRLAREVWVGDTNVTGYSTLAAAVATLNAAGTDVTLRLGAGSYEVSTDLTVNSNINLRIDNGAVITIATTKTLAINGSVDAGLYQIFSCTGTGKVLMNGTKYPQWWGALFDGSNDDSAEIQAAIDSGAGTVYCHSNVATTYGSGTIATGTFNLGTTQIVFDKAIRFIAPLDSTFVYTGATGPFLIDLSSDNYISGLHFEIGNVKSTGSYCLKINSDNSDGQLERSIIKAAGFFDYTGYGMYIDTKGAYNKIDIRNMRAGQAAPQNAWAFYYALTKTGGSGFEGNEITCGSIYNQKGIYGDYYLRYNQIDIDYDGGTQTEANKIDIAGIGNMFNVRFIGGTLVSKTDCIRLRSTATLNKFDGINYSFAGILDEAGIGSNNHFKSTPGVQNLLKNSSFESWGKLSGGTYAATDWTLSNATAEYEDTERRHGLYSVKITSTAATYANLSQALPAICTAQPVTVSGWVMAPVTNTETAALALVDNAGSASTVAIPADGKWRFIALTYTFTGATPTLHLYANITANATAGEILYVDGLTLNLGINNPVFPAPIEDRVLFAEGLFNATVNNAALGTITINCLGAAIGDPISVSCKDATANAAGMMFNANATSADTIVVSVYNHTGGNVAINGNFRVAVHKDGH